MSELQSGNAPRTGRHLASGTAPEQPRRRAAAPRRSQRQEPSGRRAAAPKREEKTARRGHAARTRPKWFKICLLVYLGLLGIGTIYLQVTLWMYLARSQAEMDRQEAELAAKVAQEKALYEAPQRSFEQWWDSQSASDWAELWYSSHEPNEMETREQVSNYLGQVFAPDNAQAYKAEGFSNTTPIYLIKNGDQPLARVSLTGKDLDWSISSVEMLLAGDRTASVTVPNSCRVTFNGIQLDEQFKQPAESRMHYEPLKGMLEEPVTWVTYTAEGLVAEPEITVEPPAGCKLFQNEDGDYLLTMDANVSKYTELSVKFVRAFLNYYMNGYNNTRYNMNNVLGFLNRDTQAYQDILDTYSSVSWATYYLSIDTSDTTAGDAVVWSNNCFSIDVTYDADCMLMGEHVDYANATMRVYFLRSENDYYISHFETL